MNWYMSLFDFRHRSRSFGSHDQPNGTADLSPNLYKYVPNDHVSTEIRTARRRESVHGDNDLASHMAPLDL